MVTWVVGLLYLCCAVDGTRAVTRTVTRTACDAAFAANDWPAVLETCGPSTAGGARPHGRMQHAWAQAYGGHREEALVEAAALYDSSERAEARFLGGWILTKQADRIEESRRLLTDALGLFAAAGNVLRAADAASALVRLALDQRR